MLRKKLAIPAAAVVAVGGALGAGMPNGHAHAKAAAANYSGTIAITDWQVPDGTPFGWATSGTVVDQEIGQPLESSALIYDDKANLVPQISSNVPKLQSVNGNTVVTYHLQPLKWSDGSPVTNADYIGQLLLYFSPDISNTTQYDQIQTVTFSGSDMTVTFKGTYAPAQSVGALTPVPLEYYEKKYSAPLTGITTTSWDYSKMVDPKTDVIKASLYASSGLKKMATAWTSDYYNSPSDIFDGPFKLSEWVADQRYTLVPNPNYTLYAGQPQGHARLAKLQFVVVSEDNGTLDRALTTDQTYNTIDKAEDFQLIDLPTLKQSKYKIVTPAGIEFEHLELNTSHKPLNDVRVRNALDYAIDKFGYLQALAPAASSAEVHDLADGSFFPNAHPYYDPSIPKSSYDPTKAKALLAAAGYSKGLSLDFWTTTAPARVRSGQLLQRYWARIGITTRLHFTKGGGANGFFSQYPDGGINATGHFDISEFAWSISPEPDGFLTLLDPSQIPNATHPNAQNYARINDPKIVQYIKQGRQTLDNAQRRKIYNDLQVYFKSQDYWISLYDRPNIVLYKPTVGNLLPNPTSQGNEWNSWAWYRAAAQ